MLTNFDDNQCHKWALLLKQRQKKLDMLILDIENNPSYVDNKLFYEIFYGCKSKKGEPGMFGSLLYHMAMVSKMNTEANMLLESLELPLPDIKDNLRRFYNDFCSDVKILAEDFNLNLSFNISNDLVPSTDDKILKFTALKNKTDLISKMINSKDSNTVPALRALFFEWTQNIIEMRLFQEYETIKGILILFELSKNIGAKNLENSIEKIQDIFGNKTVNIALNVTLKLGFPREKLQSIMLSDHYINHTMNIETLDGSMEFFNCPIFGAHNYILEKLRCDNQVISLFCKHFCYSHAKAMLETVLPFPFQLMQPKRLGLDSNCEFYMKLGFSPQFTKKVKYKPLIISWNLTKSCNLNCSHCYINSLSKPTYSSNELNTIESKKLIDQISDLCNPMLILSGGEPLLRKDIFEIIKYGSNKGFKMALGSNGTLIDKNIAEKLKLSGIKTVSVSIDSAVAKKHDEFRGVPGSWLKAINAIKELRNNDILVQVNTTVTQQNYDEIDDILTLAEKLEVENFHLFFLVPTGRGVKIDDISPEMYENMIKNTFAKTAMHNLNVRPSCAPQFMRIASDLNLDMRQWIKGCISGLYYCRIYPNGDVTPCPYLPIKLGNIREIPFKEIWFNSEVFSNLRDTSKLKGKCGICDYRNVCGGCRARAYGLSSDFIDFCGDLHEPTEVKGDYLAEDPWCVYKPKI